MKFLSIVLLVFTFTKDLSAAPTATRVETDPELTAGYTEGDMILGEERNGLINETYRWPDRIVYYYINSYIGKILYNVK